MKYKVTKKLEDKYDLSFDSSLDEEATRAEIRRRLFEGKLSPQSASVMLKDMLDQKKLQLQRITVYHKVGQLQQVEREVIESSKLQIGMGK